MCHASLLRNVQRKSFAKYFGVACSFHIYRCTEWNSAIVVQIRCTFVRASFARTYAELCIYALCIKFKFPTVPYSFVDRNCMKKMICSTMHLKFVWTKFKSYNNVKITGRTCNRALVPHCPNVSHFECKVPPSEGGAPEVGSTKGPHGPTKGPKMGARLGLTTILDWLEQSWN